MSLRGSLDTFALPDVLALLATTAKSGELDVTSTAGGGQVWVENGHIVAAESDATSDPVDVLVGLLRLEEGDFAFHGERQAPAPGDPVDVASLLEAAETRLAEWQEVEAVLPSPRAVLTLVSSASGAVRLSRDQWAAVVAVGEGRSVEELVERLGGDELDRWRLLVGLVEAGLVEVGAVRHVAPVGRTELAEQLSTITVATLTEHPASEAEAPAALASPDEVEEDDELLRTDDDAEADEPAAEPVAATASQAAQTPPAESAEAVSRGTLLKFLSSVRS